MPQTPLGFALQSFPFSESRAAFRRPVASLRVRTRPMTGTNAPAISDRFHRRAPPEPRVDPCGPTARQGQGDASSPRSSCQAALSNARVAPHANLGRPTGTLGHCRHTAARPLRSLAPSESPFTRPIAPPAEARARELAPPHAAIVRAGSLLGFSPSRAFSTTTPGSVDCEERPGRTGRPSEDHAPLR